MKKGNLAVLIAILIALSATSLPAGDLPKLIVQITVDQLRGDLPLRYRDRFKPGGFLYFMDHGTWYTDAHHAHSLTETTVGHSTLATGAYPSRHGMVANSWFDRTTNSLVDNIRTTQYPILSVNGETQSGPGASPMSILTTTFSDELAMSTNSQSKIYSVSVKDRGAIPLAGHTGKAFWYSTSNGCFVSSTFYYPTAYPDWVKSWCATNPSGKYSNTVWTLLEKRPTYLFHNITNEYPAGSPAAYNMKQLVGLKFGTTFPHTFVLTGSNFYTSLTISPRGDELTLNFAEELIRNERLGGGSVPDYLAISFSSQDLISHWFSPASLESEDNMLRLDEILRKLLSFIDKQVGLKNTLVVLSGDHGGVEYPEYLSSIGITTGRLTPDDITGAATLALAARYPGVDGIIAKWSSPYFYLNQTVIIENKLDQDEVERVIADGVMTLKGVRAALTSSDMRSVNGDLDQEMVAQVRHNYNPQRSGDVYVVQQPQWQIQEVGPSDEGPAPLLQHGSPWTYDTYVPIAFAGGHEPAAMIARRVYTVGVAATLSTILKIKFPSGCTAAPLTEALPPKTLVTAKPSH